MMLSRHILSSCVLITLGFLVSVCAGQPDSSSPGNCQLACGLAKIGASDMRVRFLAKTPIVVSCQGIADGQNYIGTVPIRFVIERLKGPTLPAETVPGDAADSKPKPFEDVGIPTPGISFEPIIESGYLGPDNPDDDQFKYKGIVTGQTEWCTDSCGVGAIDLVPLCKSVTNPITLLVHSGPVSGETIITVTP